MYRAFGAFLNSTRWFGDMGVLLGSDMHVNWLKPAYLIHENQV
jgi:hypothetical protein